MHLLMQKSCISRCFNRPSALSLSLSRFDRCYTELAYDMYENTKVRSTNAKFVDIVFTHGILGSKRNWRTPSKLLTNQVPNARVYTVDYRGHGKSHNIISKTPNDIDNCVLDLHHMFSSMHMSQKIPDVLVGHSFGGKVVLQYLQSSSIVKPRDVWILDSLPGLFDDSISGISDKESVMGIFEILQDLPKTFSSSAEAISLLVSKGISKPVAQWLTINCRPIGPLDSEILTSFSPDAVTWGFDLGVTCDLFHDFCALDMWPFLEQFDGKSAAIEGKDCHIHFVRAGKNPLWTPEVIEKFEHMCNKNPCIHLHTIPHVGHWLHVDDPHAMLEVMRQNSSL